MTWDGMAEVVGIDRRDLQRILGGRMVTRRISALILAAESRLEENPDLRLTGKKLLREGDRVRWMTNCLLARGWTSEWIGVQMGWTHGFSTSTIDWDLIHVTTLARIEGVFKAYHTEWGPARQSAVQAWRAGKFLSDCYEWDTENPDYRPIPGSLHPDLVREALVYSPDYRHRRRSMAETFHKRYGQWELGRCATAAWIGWSRVVQPDSVDITDIPPKEICGVAYHQHSVLPEVWQGSQEPWLHGMVLGDGGITR